MPDITMCKNYKCPRRYECYRYRAIPFKFQSYSDYRLINSKCSYFMPLIAGDQLREVVKIDEALQTMR